MLVSELREKPVVNVVNGSELGLVVDLVIEPLQGRIISLIVKPAFNVLQIFRKQTDIIINVNQIVKIGEDYIIVNYLDIC